MATRAKRRSRTPEQASVEVAVAEAIRNLFYDYAHCLDDDRLEEWPEFFVADGLYRVIPRENLAFDPPLAIIYGDNRDQLGDRVLIIRKALVYSLRYGRHLASNIRVVGASGGVHRVWASYIACATDQVDGTTSLASAGKYEALVVVADGRWRLKQLDVLLDTYSVDRQIAIPL